MNGIGSGTKDDMAETDATREAARRMIERKYQVTSDFLRVNDLAKMIGIAASSIRMQISEGRFPIPHRKVGNVIVVRVDDYIDWHGAGSMPVQIREEEGAAETAPVVVAHESIEEIAEPEEAEPRRPLLPRAETKQQQAERIKQEVLASMRRRKLR